jgi:hypothetical protein
MALLVKQLVQTVGKKLTFAAAAGGGDTVKNDQRDGSTTFICLNNLLGAAPCVVTLNDPKSVGPPGAKQFDPDLEVTVPAGEYWMIGPLSAGRFNDASDIISWTYSQVVAVTVAVIYA